MKANKAKLTAVADLTPNPENPRRIFDDRMDELKASITEDPEFLWARPLVATSAGVVYAGNQRLRAAIELGMKRVPVVTLDGTPDEIQLRLLRDNQEYGEWETPAVGKMIAGLKERGVDVGLSGFEKGEIESAVAAWRRQERGDPDEIPEVTGKAKSKRGQVYELGPHRVMCGDATSSDDVAKVLDGAEPNLMVTDPPYGVGYDAGWRNEAAEKGQIAYGASRVSDVVNDDRGDWGEAWALFPGDVSYVYHAGAAASVAQASIEQAGFQIRCQIIWAKAIAPITRGHYRWGHEPCWYAVRKGATAGWSGDHKQTTVWEIALDKNVEGGHSTQKPVECMAKPIRNHKGDAYDPFLGSGTTLIACEQTGRICYGMEIEPKYVDVIRQRHADFVGDQQWAP